MTEIAKGKNKKFNGKGALKNKNNFKKNAGAVKSNGAKKQKNGVINEEAPKAPAVAPYVAKVTKSKKAAPSEAQMPAVKHRDEQKWYQYQIPGKVEDPEKDQLSPEKAKEVFDEADLLLRTDNDLYNRRLRKDGGSEASWLLSVVKKGTASDRMTAMQLQMHKSPVHSLPYAESLVMAIEKKNTREALGTIPILEEIFLNHYLPVNRKLISFSSRPLARIMEICANSEPARKRMLVLWMFEHRLKDLYARYLKALETIAAGVVVDLSKAALSAALNLLAGRPEGEQMLLTMIANKLGHPNYRVGSHVAFLLEDLSKRQPSMRAIIVNEVERVVYRKNVNERAHLYAATFLSQLILRAGESDLAVHLLSIYFGLFKTLVARRKTDNRLITILLSACNRAFPYAKEKAESLLDDFESLYKLVHTGNYSVALQTLKLLFQVLHLNDTLSDRYYTTLYRKLLDPIPPACYNQLMLLLYRSLKQDVAHNRVRAFCKRLLQIATGAAPPMAAGILFLVSKLAELKPDQKYIIVTKQSDPAAKIAVTLGDDDEEERYMDLDTHGKPIVPVAAKKEEPKDSEAYSDEEEEEKLDEFGEKLDAKKPAGGPASNTPEGWVHKSTRKMRSPYDQECRNPLFADYQLVADSELLLLSKHYHPSVAIFATQLLEGKYINYKGDPLEDYTLMKFLDRFAFKNPKDGSAPTSSGSVMKKKAYDPWGMKKLNVTSKDYVSKNRGEMPNDEKYLHRFAQLKFQTKVKEEKKKDGEEEENEDDWDHESIGSEDFDRMIERFEPGEANGDFELDGDFGEEFTVEKNRTSKKRKMEEEDGEDDELLDDELGGMPEPDSDDEEEEDDDDNDNDDDDDEDDIESDSDGDDDDERAFSRQKLDLGGGSGSDTDDFGENDAEVAADKFDALLDDMDEEAAEKTKMKKKKMIKKGSSSSRGRRR